MTGNEAIVIVLCLIIGYWAVSKSMSGKPRSRTTRQEPKGAAKPRPETETEHQPNRESEPRSQSGAWHRVLSVEPNASVEEIRQAYRQLISQYHPDKVAALGEELRTLAERKSKDITSAYREAMNIRGTP
jgi:DnaJ like chaperone protein